MSAYFIKHKDQFDGLSMEDQDVILQMLTNAIQYDQRVCLYGLDNRLYEANLLAIDEALEYYHNGELKSYLLPLPLYKEFTGQISHVGKMKDYLESIYKKFRDFTIDEHLCDEDVAYICERWLMDANLTEYLSYRNKRER